MADDNRIGSSRVSGISSLSAESLKQALGVGAPKSGGNGDVGASAGGAARNPARGARGNRMLPADYPVDQLDRKAARGTYLDLLI